MKGFQRLKENNDVNKKFENARLDQISVRGPVVQKKNRCTGRFKREKPEKTMLTGDESVVRGKQGHRKEKSRTGLVFNSHEVNRKSKQRRQNPLKQGSPLCL